MVRLYAVRHAKTDWNIGRIIQGRSDIPLSGEGKAAAKAAAQFFSGVKIDKVFCSPLSRARQTQELMLGLPYDVDERLIEREFGSYDGRDYSVMTEEERSKLFYDMDSVDGAETGRELFDRTRAFAEFLKKEYDGKTVAIFSHGVCLSYLLHAIKHASWDPGQYEMQYVKHCEIVTAEF